MKKKIKLGFADKWGGFVPEEDFYYKLLARHYDIELSDTPDYLICSQNGHSHIKYDCVKIVDIGENIVLDFNEFDYAVGFDHLEFGDRYLRVPLYVFFAEYPKLAERATPPPDDVLLNRKFCSFVVTNGGYGDPMRTKFFHALSKYKRVDSGGRYLNNIGGNVKDKMAFCSQYKFNIAFENSSSPGYTTEKVMQPLSCFSVPIYWGNPLIAEDFSPASLVCVKDEADFDRAIEEIIRLDTDDAAYLEKAKAPCLSSRMTTTKRSSRGSSATSSTSQLRKRIASTSTGSRLFTGPGCAGSMPSKTRLPRQSNVCVESSLALENYALFSEIIGCHAC